MKPEQQRIAIAEACRWGVFANTRPTDLPDYLNDLNAMHEAEKTFNPLKKAEYAIMLTSIAWQSEQPTFAPMTATAAQRAEAFLRTINKWEETK
ncbi:MAG: hypothetical protein ACK48S_09775 [Planctomycetia bacterium]